MDRHDHPERRPARVPEVVGAALHAVNREAGALEGSDDLGRT
jgi:hypothetical protein